MKKKKGNTKIKKKKKKKRIINHKEKYNKFCKKRKSKYSMKIVDLRWGKATIPSNTICLRTERNPY